MRKFVDLNLRPLIRDIDQVETMVNKSSELGYHCVGISIPQGAKRKEIRMLEKICNDVGIDLATRVDLFPKTPRELLSNLRRVRRRFEVVSVICASKPVARQAAKDRRVDLLLFPTDSRKRFFDLAEAKLASGVSASLEITTEPLLLLRGISKIRLLSCLRREAKIAKKFNVPIVVSSGATTEYLLRTPQDNAALTTLFDLTLPHRLCAISENPKAIIVRNRGKLSKDYVAPNVRVIRRGKPCSSV